MTTSGRPPRVYRALLEELSARTLREMWQVVTDPEHPLHDEHGPKMLCDLVRVCTPRIGHVGVFEQNGILDAIEPQPVAGRAVRRHGPWSRVGRDDT